MAVALGLGCSSVRGGCAEVLQRKTFAQICEAPLTDADAKLAQSLSEEDLKKVVEKASIGKDSNVSHSYFINDCGHQP